MYNKIKWIGAFALILCLAAIVIVPASDDSDADPTPYSDFSEAINEYSDAVLGNGQTMVKSSLEGTTVVINVETSLIAIQSLNINLTQPYTQFTTSFNGMTVKAYDTVGTTQRSTLTIINNGQPGSISEFTIRVLEQVRQDFATKEVSVYNGIVMYGNSATEYGLKINVYIDSQFKALAQTLTKNVDITAKYNAQGFCGVGIDAKMTEALYTVLGSKSVTALSQTKVLDVMTALAADGALATLVTDSSLRAYINAICDEIKGATNFVKYLYQNVTMVGKATYPHFNAADVSTATGFQGLMATLKNMMENYGTDTVSKYADVSGSKLDFEMVKVTITEDGTSGTFTRTIPVEPVLDYGTKTIAVSVTGGSAAINGKSSDTVIPGNEATLTISPDSGYDIESVVYKVDNKVVKTLSNMTSQTFTVLFGGVISDAIEVTCSGQPEPPSTYTITVENDGHGTGSASASTASAGTTITLTSEPAEGYVFDKWVSDDVTVSANNTFTMPAKNVTVKATFKQAYTITVNTDGHGAASASAKAAAPGTIITLTASADEGYMFDEWESEDVTIAFDEFEMPAKNVTVTAKFIEIPKIYYTFDIPTGLNGVIDGPSIVEAGESATFTIVGAPDYILVDFIVDGTSMGAIAIYTFENVSANHTLDATFEYKKGAETEVDPEGNVTESYEDTIDDIEVEVVKETNVDGSSSATATSYDEETEVTTIASITDDGAGEVELIIASTVEGNEMTETQLEVAQNAATAAAKAIGIEEKDIEVTVVLDATTETKDKEIDVAIDITKYDQKSTIAITGDKAAIEIDSGTMNGMQKVGNNVKVNVAEKPESSMTDKQKEMAAGNTVFDVNATVNDTRIHMLEGKAYLALPIELPPGATPADVSIYYMTDDGEVSKIATEYVDGAAVGELTHFSMYFAAVNYVDPSAEYTVTVQKSGNGTATASPDKARAGTTITLTATAADGYKFKEWTSADVEIENNSFVMPAGNVTVKAIFEKVEPTPSGGSDNMPYIILAVIIVIALVGCAAFWYFRKS